MYNAAVAAVARGSRRVEGKIGDIVLQSGDTLLLEADEDFVSRERNSSHFFLMSGVENSQPLNTTALDCHHRLGGCDRNRNDRLARTGSDLRLGWRRADDRYCDAVRSVRLGRVSIGHCW